MNVLGALLAAVLAGDLMYEVADGGGEQVVVHAEPCPGQPARDRSS